MTRLIDLVLANPDKEWDWAELSWNPSITMADVPANSELPWDCVRLSDNRFGYDESGSIEYHSKRRAQTIERTKIFEEELMVKVWHPEGAMFQYYLEEARENLKVEVNAGKTSDVDDLMLMLMKNSGKCGLW